MALLFAAAAWGGSCRGRDPARVADSARPSGKQTAPPAATPEPTTCWPLTPADVEDALGPNATLAASPPESPRRQCYVFEAGVDPTKVRGPSPELDGRSLDFIHLDWMACDRWETTRTSDQFNQPLPALGDVAFDRNGIVGVRKRDVCFMVSGRVHRSGANHNPYRALAGTIAGRL